MEKEANLDHHRTSRVPPHIRSKLASRPTALPSSLASLLLSPKRSLVAKMGEDGTIWSPVLRRSSCSVPSDLDGHLSEPLPSPHRNGRVFPMSGTTPYRLSRTSQDSSAPEELSHYMASSGAFQALPFPHSHHADVSSDALREMDNLLITNAHQHSLHSVENINLTESPTSEGSVQVVKLNSPSSPLIEFPKNGFKSPLTPAKFPFHSPRKPPLPYKLLPLWHSVDHDLQSKDEKVSCSPSESLTKQRMPPLNGMKAKAAPSNSIKSKAGLRGSPQIKRKLAGAAKGTSKGHGPVTRTGVVGMIDRAHRSSSLPSETGSRVKSNDGESSLGDMRRAPSLESADSRSTNSATPCSPDCELMDEDASEGEIESLSKTRGGQSVQKWRSSETLRPIQQPKCDAIRASSKRMARGAGDDDDDWDSDQNCWRSEDDRRVAGVCGAGDGAGDSRLSSAVSSASQDSWVAGGDEEDVLDCLEDDDVGGLEDDDVVGSDEELVDDEEEDSASVGPDDVDKIAPDGDVRNTALVLSHSPLIQSRFPNVPPVLRFVKEGEKVKRLAWEHRKLLRWRLSTITPIVVKRAISRSGFTISKKSYDWIGYFGKHMKAPGFKSIRDYQKVNHFPGSFQIGRKDRLWINLYRMQIQFGKREFNFFPRTFCLPNDLRKLKRIWEDGGNKHKWIIKPPASARGIGVRVVHKWNQIPKRRPVVVQKYLSRPFLINGSKFDLRIYVYVSSFDPLRIYVHEDGLVRFASQQYSSLTRNLGNRYMHLTNYSVNKKNQAYTNNTDETACQGHKWTLQTLWSYLADRGVDTQRVWSQIKDLVVKTIVSTDGPVNSLVKAHCKWRRCVHELFGFDVLLDDKFKPWILEVNISPSLHSNSPLDVQVKSSMVADMLTLAGFQVPDRADLVPSSSSTNSTTSLPHDYQPANTVCADRRLWDPPLAPDERAKHAFYTQRVADEQVQSTILDILTPSDVRMLVESVDEWSRSGAFEMVYPYPGWQGAKYLRFISQPRYYNLLLHAYLSKYNKMEAKGEALLASLCAKQVHLSFGSVNQDPMHQWTPPNGSGSLPPRISSSIKYNRAGPGSSRRQSALRNGTAKGREPHSSSAVAFS